jgi:hypothetical protein
MLRVFVEDGDFGAIFALKGALLVWGGFSVGKLARFLLRGLYCLLSLCVYGIPVLPLAICIMVSVVVVRVVVHGLWPGPTTTALACVGLCKVSSAGMFGGLCHG